jgi:hypothetical protein
LLGKSLEPMHIELVGFDHQPVTGAGLLNRVAVADRSTKPRDQRLQCVGGLGRRLVTPERVDQCGARGRARCNQGERNEQPTEPTARDVERPVTVSDL